MTKVLVVGESCTDIFIYCNAQRLAPDLPVPVLEVEFQVTNPGMAANVQRNIEALGKKSDIITNPNWEDVSKTRFMHSQTNHMFVRVDTSHLISPCEAKFHFDSYDAVVISDYDKGFLSREMIAGICELAPLVFLDTKKPIDTWALGASFIKINDYEYQRSVPTLTPELNAKIVHTKGADGAYFGNQHFPVAPVEVGDASGAGDAFMAALVVAFLETRDMVESIKSANRHASEVVQKRGVSVVSR